MTKIKWEDSDPCVHYLDLTEDEENEWRWFGLMRKAGLSDDEIRTAWRERERAGKHAGAAGDNEENRDG